MENSSVARGRQIQDALGAPLANSFEIRRKEFERTAYEENLCHLSNFVHAISEHNEANVLPKVEWTDGLTNVLKDIAKTGTLRYPWSLVKFLWCYSFEMLVSELRAKSGKPLTEDEDSVVDSIRTKVQQRTAAPFTLQRLAELVLPGDRTHKRTGLLIFAVSRNVFGVESALRETLPEGFLSTVVDSEALAKLESKIPTRAVYSAGEHAPSSKVSSADSTPVGRRSLSCSHQTVNRSHGHEKDFGRRVSKAVQNSARAAEICGSSRSIKKERRRTDVLKRKGRGNCDT